MSTIAIRGKNQGSDGIVTVTSDGNKRRLDVSTDSSGGGSAAGGGLSTYYAKPSGTNADATSAYASATTLTITGLPYTFTKYDIVEIKQVPNAGGAGAQDTSFTDVADFSVSGTTITVSGATFAATDEFIVTFALPPKSVDEANDAKRQEIINRDTDKDTSDTLLALTNIAQSTTAYGYLDVENVDYWTLQCETSGATPTDVLTLTIEATCQNDGTAAASCAYHDITEMVYDYITGTTSNASYVDADCVLGMNQASKFKYIRIKYATSAGGGNDADLTVYTTKGC